MSIFLPYPLKRPLAFVQVSTGGDLCKDLPRQEGLNSPSPQPQCSVVLAAHMVYVINETKEEPPMG